MTLGGKKVAMLVDEGYEDLEFWYPYYRLKEEGADVVVAAHERKAYGSKHGYPAQPDVEAKDLRPEDFDAVVIPGGAVCPDRLRRHREILDFVRKMDDAGRPVAAICHAGWVPVSAGIVKGRRMTSFVSIKDDCANAGATWVDKECVVDGNLITSRYPDDLPAFCRAIIHALAP
jgi:protease I